MRLVSRLSSRSGAVRRCLMIFAALALLAGTAANADTYNYDANGRLRAVTDTSGNSSQYNYDALGNLQSIVAVPSGQLAIFSFLPNHGSVGTSVTIQGQGFSSTASANGVTFNGTAAVVSSATANQLVAAVPPGASSGPISVTVGSTTATSADSFVVTGDSGGAPTISSFSPAVANAGMSVTVNGSGFIAAAGPTQAGVNLDTATVTPASNTQLTFPVPTATGSGPVTVSTPFGTAQSAQALIVVPTSVGASNVVTTAQLTAGAAPTALSINTANKYAVAIFQGSAGQWPSLQFSQLNTTPAAGRLNISVYDPSGQDIYNASIANPAQQSNDMSAHLAQLAMTGTYTLIMTPASGATGSFSVALQSDPMIDPVTHMVPITVSVPGQTQRAIYQAADGDYIGIGMTNVAMTPSANSMIDASLYSADGYTVDRVGAICGAPGYYQCSGWARNLAAGFYGVVVGTYEGPVQTFSAQLWVTPDATGTLTVGTPTTIATSYPAQNATYTFQGTAGQQLNLAVDQIVMASGIPLINYSVLDPNGNCVLQFGTATLCPQYVQSGTNTGVYYQGLVLLPLTGTYSVIVNPGGVYETQAGTGTIRLTLSQTITATLPLDVAAGTTAATTVEGQQIQYTFQVTTPGDNLGFGLANVVTAPGGQVEADIFGPNGNEIAVSVCSNPGYSACSASLRNLAVGTYKVVLKPSDTRTQSFSVQVYLSHDVTGTMTVGTPTTIATAIPGQNATYTFQGTAGEQLNLALDQVVLGPGVALINASVLDPSGNCVLALGTSTGCPIDPTRTVNYAALVPLTVTGTYTVFVSPGGIYETQAGTGSVRATLSQTLTATLPLDAASGTAVATTVEGQNLKYTFTVTTPGDNLGFAMTQVVVSPSNPNGAVEADIYNSAGTLITWTACGSSCAANLRGLDAGTYTIVLKPYDDTSAPAQTFSAQIYVMHDVTGTLAVGTPTTIATTLPGQSATYTFQGTAGQQLTLAIDQIALSSGNAYVSYSITDPTGKCIVPGSGGGCQMLVSGTTYQSLTVLPSTGTYTVFVEPYQSVAAGTESARFTLSQTITGTLPLDAPSGTNVATTVVGQQLQYSFQVTTPGDNLGLGLTNVVTNPSGGPQQFSASVYGPANTLVGQANCPGQASCVLPLRNLAAGTYKIVFSPNKYAQTFSATVYLTHDVTGTLTPGTPATIAMTVPGQNATYTFQAIAGQKLTLAFSNVVLGSSAWYVATQVHDPSGASLGNYSIANTTTENATATTSGTYTLIFIPLNYTGSATTASLQVDITAN